MLTDGGAFVAVIEWGDITSGDPATDLAAIWMLLPQASAARAEAWAHYGAPDLPLRARARGWAMCFAAMLSALVDDPRHVAAGERTFRNLSEDLG